MFSHELNPQLDMAEFEATLKEFQEDYNQKHFVRNDSFQVRHRSLLPGAFLGVSHALSLGGQQKKQTAAQDAEVDAWGWAGAEQKAAESIQGPTRRIFIEFLERSCTAEFSGFLLYKELGRRLKVRHHNNTHPPTDATCR